LDVQLWHWIAFAALVVVLVAVDLFAFEHRHGPPRMGQAIGWSVVWLAVGAGFTAVVWAWAGGGPAGEYLTGYLIERTLSIDNVFVLVLLFGALGVPAAARGWAVTWGILVALVLRAVMIAAGASLLGAASWVAYLFAAFLIANGLRIAGGHPPEVHPERSRLLAAARRMLPVARGYDGGRLVVREDGARRASPLVIVALAIAVADLVFALDSIPSIFAVTRETFLVVAANALALVGLRSMYELLAGMVGRFRYLNLGLGAVLVLVGAKMALAGVVHPPAWLTLAAVAAIVAAAIAASLAIPPADARLPRPKGPVRVPDA